MRFRYLLDPLFLMCLSLFLINKLLLRPFIDHPFLYGHLNDCICMAVWVPVLLTVMRLLRLRNHDHPPHAHEILIPLVVWSWVFEVWLPQTAAFAGIAIADVWDVLCYVVGALVAVLVWNWYYRNSSAGDFEVPNAVVAEQKPDRPREDITG